MSKEEVPAVKKSSTTNPQASAKLKDEGINPFMPETDPKNPYGPNYEELPYETKVYYKFNKIRKHVHLDKEDDERIVKFNLTFMFGILGSALLGCGVGYGIRRAIFKPYFVRIDDALIDYGRPYYGVFFAGAATIAYNYFSQRYVEEVCIPLTSKYIKTATENGFQDYKISEHREINTDSLLKDVRKFG